MRRKISLLVTLAALAAACGSAAPEIGDAPPPAPTEATEAAPTSPGRADDAVAATTALPDFPASLEGAGFRIYLEERPEAIISLSPTATEILFAIGAGDQVIAVDDQSDYPAGTPMTDLSGWEPNVEAIAAYEPDLVIISFDPGAVQESLEGLGIPVIIQGPAPSIDQAYDQMLQLGIATGHEEEAIALSDRMREEIEALSDRYLVPGESRTYYYELDENLYSVTSDTVQGEAAAIFGLNNIADPLQESSGFYPQLSAEYIVEQDPDIIFFGCGPSCGTTAEIIAARDGWGSIRAVRGGHIIELDPDLSSRWGPRLVDFAAMVGQSIPPPETGFPVTVTGTDFSVTLEERPAAIISLSPTATEMLFAIGAGDQVIAVDDQSDYPPGVPVTDLSGWEPNVEAIAAYEPDLAVISFDPGGVRDSLEALDIPVIIQGPAQDLEGVYEQLRQLGAAAGVADETAGLVESMRTRIEELAERYGPLGVGRSFYYELDDTFFSVTSSTIAGQVFALFGLENIADGMPEGAGSYPQLSAEYIVESDPDLIFFGCGEFCDTTSETISAREGWDSIGAVRDGAVIEMDPDLASRWGPRLAEFVELVGEALSATRG